jgi:hypothetical protein
MNQFNAFAHKHHSGQFIAYVRFDRDGSAKPVLDRGGKPLVFLEELHALQAAVTHLLRYINGHFVRDGEVLPAAVAADSHFKPQFRKARKNGKRKARRRAAQ